MKHKINDKVQHITSDIYNGIVVDYRIYKNREMEYLVSFSRDTSAWIFENELVPYTAPKPLVLSFNSN